ncbi:MAG: hypothetical protein JRG87_09175 [Deltaproteobacteria bacterium]|nr:hypothetical protein [Deltaproteobacteria bacterium]MBW1826173.1 hypothetical protein [Deltaproteobacteria bacterium]MBW2156803.1 hypothetical protein [Deltaproteobacteria bacterium]MBW2197733.1 hypothetical protein [Deltaproteobacteria bacterium]MBW2227215.1 hypothetical protein [Deltaproteobacteria bacterium]
MTNVVDIQAYRAKVIEQRAFGSWEKRFGESYHINTKLSDLSDAALHFLAQPGESSAVAFYELIMGILDLGPAIKFNYLPNREQIAVVDIHLFLADQVRFEIMRRLKWLINLLCEKYGLVEMVQDFDTVKTECTGTFPELAPAHPDYPAYAQLPHSERESFIRRMLRDALESFKDRLGF